MRQGSLCGFFQTGYGLPYEVVRGVLVLVLFIMLAVPVQAYDFRDVVRNMEPEGKGTDIAIEYVSFLQRFVKLADRDENARTLFYLLREAVMDFDLARLYQSDYFSQWDNGFYGVSLKGDVCSDDIEMQIISHDEAVKACEKLKDFGSFIGEFAIRKNLNPCAGRLSDVLVAEGNWISGDISWVHIARLLDNLMRVIDPDNLDLLRQLRDVEPGEPLDVTDVFRENFPRLFIDKKILDLSSSAVIKTVDGCRYTDFTLNVGSNPEGIEAFFPLVAKFMKKMNKHGSMDIVLKDMQGRKLLGLFLGAQKDFFRLEVCTRNGMAIPVDTILDKPVMADAFAVHLLENYECEPHISMRGKALGLKVSISNQIFSSEYATDGQDMRFAHKMKNKANVDISGAIFGIIPIAIVNMIIPGTVKSLADDFATVMMQANRGEGTLFGVEWKIKEPIANRFYWRGQTELPDNDFIRIGMKMFARMFLMDEETFDEFRLLISMAMDCLLLDLYSMRM